MAAMLGLTPALFVYRQRWPWMLWVLVGAGTGLVALLVPPLILMWLRKGAALAIAGFFAGQSHVSGFKHRPAPDSRTGDAGADSLMGSRH